MATVGNEPNGRKRILFVDADGSRKTLRLGKCDPRTAEAICRHVEHLLAAKLSGQPVPRETAAWLGSVGSKLKERLAKVGLIAGESKAPTVSDLARRYLSRADVKASTKQIRGYWADRLAAHFGNRPVTDVGLRDAEALRDALLAEGLAAPTVGRMLRFSRQLFGIAVRDGILTRNPFDALKYAFREGPGLSRDYASAEDVGKLLEVCPPAWKVLIGLTRFAALRCPSEALLLRWADVNLPERRMTVTSPKTASAGKPWRIVPIFDPLAGILAEAFELAPEGAEYVVNLPEYRAKAANWTSCNVRTQAYKLMRQAGVFWHRPFRVLRSSCVTDWAKQHPVHLVAHWAGHTVAVAGRHYLTVTPEDLGAGLKQGKTGREVYKHTAAQNPAQYVPETSRRELYSRSGSLRVSRRKPQVVEGKGIVYKQQTTPPGFEPGMREPKSLVLPVTPRGKPLTILGSMCSHGES
ncbi:MAG: site-specific integrase [Gemmatales bacterium]|nr:site-specific integrase [Gemmatales bacterium]MDW8385422.1 site-specific integrase [Gemmatales bacterium]